MNDLIVDFSSIVYLLFLILVIIFFFYKFIFEKKKPFFESNYYFELSQSKYKPTKWHSFVLNMVIHYKMLQSVLVVLIILIDFPFITNMSPGQIAFSSIFFIIFCVFSVSYIKFLISVKTLKNDISDKNKQSKAAKSAKMCAMICFAPDAITLFTDYCYNFDDSDFYFTIIFSILVLIGLGFANYVYFNKRMDFYDYSRVINEKNNQYVAPAPVVNAVHVQQASAPIVTPQPTVKIERPQPTVQTAAPQPTVQPAKPQPVPQKPVAQAAVPQPVVHNDTSGRYSELYELKKLLDSGLITQEDYDKKKNQILNL